MIKLGGISDIAKGKWTNPLDKLREKKLPSTGNKSLDEYGQSIVNSVNSKIDKNLGKVLSTVNNAMSEYEKILGGVNDSSSGIISKTYRDSSTPRLDYSGNSNKGTYQITKEYIPCYIINLVTGTTIEFDITPDSIEDSNSASFDAQGIRGRSSPYQGYSESGPRTVSYSVTLHHDLCKDGLLNTINKLKALTYPEYGGVLQLPQCLIRVGDMIHCRAIVGDVSVSWNKPMRDGLYLVAEVNLSFTEVVDRPYGASEIESKGGYI